MVHRLPPCVRTLRGLLAAILSAAAITAGVAITISTIAHPSVAHADQGGGDQGGGDNPQTWPEYNPDDPGQWWEPGDDPGSLSPGNGDWQTGSDGPFGPLPPDPVPGQNNFWPNLVPSLTIP